MVLYWEEKFGHGSPPGLGILSYSLSSILRFGHRLCPNSVGEVLGALMLS